MKKLLLLILALLPAGARAQVNNARMLSTPNAQTGTAYTFVAADTTRVVTFSNAGAIAATLPNGATAGFGAGTMLSVVDLGAGTLTITCTLCTINGATTLVLGQNQGADLYGGAGTSAVNYIAVASLNGANGVSLANDNIFTASQRFKGPIPWRDISAYMPAGGCSSTDTSDPNTTGSITSGSTALALTAAKDFKNGCGITVLGAGATSSLVMPSSCSATMAAAANVVTVTCSTPHGIFQFPTYGSGEGIIVSGCSDGTFNGTFPLQTVPTSTTFTYNQAGTGASANGCTVTFILSWAHGTLGSTTYYYKLAACDTSGGCSAAVGPTTITNGNASLTAQNYNWLGWTMIPSVKFVCVYRSTDGVTYTAVGSSFTPGYTDRGLTSPIMQHCGTTPPTTQTAGQLTTTIVSGGGTTSLVLAATASNTATTKNVYHDETSFLASCIADVSTFQLYNAGEHGCLIPAGKYFFSSDSATDTAPHNYNGSRIYVDGTIDLNLWPWIFNNGNWAMEGMGFSGNGGTEQHFPTTELLTGANVPAAFEVQSNTTIIHGFTLGSLRGDGVRVSAPIATAANAVGIDLADMYMSESAGNTSGVPLVFDSNTLFVTGKNLNLIPNTVGIPASILWTTSSYAGNTWCCMHFTDTYTQWHHLLFESPSGNNNGIGAPIIFDHWESEDHGSYPTGGVVTVDTGNINGTPGAFPNVTPPSITINGFDNADSNSTPPHQTLIYAQGNNVASVSVGGNAYVNRTFDCAAGAGACNQPKLTMSGFSANLTSNAGYQGGTTGPANGAAEQVMQEPLVLSMPYGYYGATPVYPVIADALPGPNTMTLTSTGAGSLAAGQYCLRAVGLDDEPTPGQTLPGPEVCTTVGASSSIVVTWGTPQIFGHGGYTYSGWRLYYGSTPGAENNYILTGLGPANAVTFSYTFTSTAGNVAQAAPGSQSAFLSWLNREGYVSSCFLCVASTAQSVHWPLGVGDPNPPAGAKLSILGGNLNLAGITSGGAQVGVAAVAGAPNPILLPTTTGAAGQFLSTNGGSPQQLSWAPGGSGVFPASGTQFAIPDWSTTNTVGAVCPPPTTIGTFDVVYVNTTNAASQATCPQVGLGASTISGATAAYTVLSSDVAAGLIVHDKGASGTVVVTLPTPATLSNSNAIFIYTNHSAQMDTITPTTWTIQANTAAAGATLAIGPGASARISVDPFNATNWVADVINPPFSGFATTTYTNATTTLSNVAGLSYPVAANTNYAISCKLIYQGSASTASLVLSSTGPAAPTQVTAQVLQDTTAGAGAALFSQATNGATFGFTVGAAAIVTTATDLYSTLDIGILNGVNAGTWQLQAKSNGAGTVSIMQGSYCRVQ